LLFAATALTAPVRGQDPPRAEDLSLIGKDQRVVIVMVDGLGVDYLEQSSMPVLKGLMAKGLAKTVRGVMPSVTNVNNASICCGSWPEEHGITGNSFFDERADRAEYMEDAAYLRAPTT
jgi:phosphonoacetate hydrolase